MSKKVTETKIPIYQLESKEKVLNYYINWTQNNQYNQDMVNWNYSGPKNAVNIFKKYAHDKSIVILDAGCGTGLVAEELVNEGFHALNEFIRIVKQDGLICFTVNEGIYEEYEFDNKIKELEQNKKWQVLELKKTGYIVNKDIEAWVCIARKM